MQAVMGEENANRTLIWAVVTPKSPTRPHSQSVHLQQTTESQKKTLSIFIFILRIV